MKLLIVRNPSKGGATIGLLFVDKRIECYTLEDEVRAGQKVQGKTAIPPGTYFVIIDQSPHFKRLMPHVLDVPGYTDIRIHPGNTSADTEGCILVGRTRGITSVGESVKAFDPLFQKMKAAIARGEPITLEIRNG